MENKKNIRVFFHCGSCNRSAYRIGSVDKYLAVKYLKDQADIILIPGVFPASISGKSRCGFLVFCRINNGCFQF